VLFALAQPASFAGLLAGFVVAVLVRAVVQAVLAGRLLGSRPAGGGPLDLRRDLDVFGAVAAAISGVGWGRAAPLPYGGPGRPHDVGRRVAVLLAGPGAVLALSQLAFLGTRAAVGPTVPLLLFPPSSVLRGIPDDPLTQLSLSFAVAVLCVGLLALVPLPPLDGWFLLRLAVRRPGPGFARAVHWLEDQSVGVAVLLVLLFFPLAGGVPVLLFLLDLVAGPVQRAWA